MAMDAALRIAASSLAGHRRSQSHAAGPLSERPRKHVTHAEAESMVAAARKSGRYGHRDSTLILLTYRHGLRVAEVVALQWADVDFKAGTLYVRRDQGERQRGASAPG